VRWLNHPSSVAVAHNKVSTFQRLSFNGVPIPDTGGLEDARKWQKEGSIIVARSTATGHSGAGITIVEPGQEIPNTLFYTRYIPKKREFRVHVFQDEVILVSEKRKRKDYDGEQNNRVRSHQGGWVYCYTGINEPEGLRELAIHAVLAVGLHFGAVDIIYNERRNQCYVLEVNTAPGLEGSTVGAYAQSITGAIRGS